MKTDEFFVEILQNGGHFIRNQINENIIIENNGSIP